MEIPSEFKGMKGIFSVKYRLTADEFLETGRLHSYGVFRSTRNGQMLLASASVIERENGFEVSSRFNLPGQKPSVLIVTNNPLEAESVAYHYARDFADELAGKRKVYDFTMAQKQRVTQELRRRDLEGISKGDTQ